MIQRSKMLLLLVLFASSGLAACSPPNPTANLDLNNLKNQQGLESLDETTSSNSSTGYKLASSAEPQSSSNNSVLSFLNNKQKGPTMKQLSDFETIAATQVTLTTSKGAITFELYREQAPITTANFLNLAKQGFYNGIVFHRVIPDFMAQVGDPLTKDPSKQALWGTGGPGYTIPDEFGQGLQHDSAGIVSMANSGPNTGGSQFFITYEATPWLDGKHAIFGKVTSGMDVLKQIGVGDSITAVTYQ